MQQAIKGWRLATTSRPRYDL